MYWPKKHFLVQIVHQNGNSHECYYKSSISIITSTERRMAIVIDQNWILHKMSNISCFWHVLTKKTFFGANCTPKRYFARMVLQIMSLSINEQILHQNGFSHECYYKSFISIITLTLIPTGVAPFRHVYMFEAIFFYLRYLWTRNFDTLLFSIYCWHRMSWNIWNLYTHVLNGKYSI